MVETVVGLPERLPLPSLASVFVLPLTRSDRFRVEASSLLQSDWIWILCFSCDARVEA